MTRNGLLLVNDGKTLSAARCGEPERLVGPFADAHAIVPAPDGDAVFWLSAEDTLRLDVATWAIRKIPPGGLPYNALAVDREAVYCTYPFSGLAWALRVTHKKMVPTELAHLPNSVFWKVRVSRTYLWIDINFTTLGRTDRVRAAHAPESVVTLPVAELPVFAMWDVVAEADAALVIDEDNIAVYQGSPPVRKTLTLPAAPREICVGGPGTLYWIDRDEHVRRTALTPALTAGATEVVASGQAPYGLACAGDHVAWVYGPEDQPHVAHRRTGAKAATCR